VIRERANAGLARAKAKGTTLGRHMLHHKGTDRAALEQRIRDMAAEGTGKLKTARMLGVGVSVVQRVLAAPAAAS
jgi:DNA invertase Pin-like site-specific DNA recombinase